MSMCARYPSTGDQALVQERCCTPAKEVQEPLLPIVTVVSGSLPPSSPERDVKTPRMHRFKTLLCVTMLLAVTIFATVLLLCSTYISKNREHLELEMSAMRFTLDRTLEKLAKLEEEQAVQVKWKGECAFVKSELEKALAKAKAGTSACLEHVNACSKQLLSSKTRLQKARADLEAQAQEAKDEESRLHQGAAELQIWSTQGMASLENNSSALK